ncbi:TPA: Bro-N domain-containing protein [Stenotrophomonas maltophilia]
MSQIIPFQFDTISIRAVEIDGEPWFVGKDITDALGYADSTNALKQHCRGVVNHHPILDARGRTQDTRIISEADLWRLIARSQLPEAERIERWIFEEVLPSIRRTGSYSRPLPASQEFVAAGCALIESSAKVLRLAPSVTLGMYQRLGGKVGHQDLLPRYAVDAPADTPGSSEPTLPVSSLLKMVGAAMTAQKANQLLKSIGILEQRERTSSGKQIKKYWTLTEAGLQFGKNLTSPENPRETQPHYYVSRFGDLMDLMLGRQHGAAA